MAIFLKILAAVVCALYALAMVALANNNNSLFAVGPEALLPIAFPVVLLATTLIALGMILERVQKIERVIEQRRHEPSVRT